MSITNYFGKPRTKYVPYKSPYTFDNLPKNKYDWFHVGTNGGSDITTIYKRLGDKTTTEIQDPRESREIKDMLIKISSPIKHKLLFESTQYATIDGLDVYHFGAHTDNVFGLEDINIMFNRFLHEIIKWIEQPIWNFVKINPTTNLIQVLILKLSDVDKHTEHLEKIVASLCEDNVLLNNRIKALEQRIEKQREIPVAEPITIAEAVVKL
jgi:hypothetical protein